MKKKTYVLFCVALTMMAGCGRNTHDRGIPDLDSESAGVGNESISGAWAGTWNDPKRNTSEAFQMELTINEDEVSGKAVFKDANSTRADITGTFETGKVHLVMTPKPTSPYVSLPKTTWAGSLKNGVIVGEWQLEGRGTRGYAVSGPWTAKRLCNNSS